MYNKIIVGHENYTISKCGVVTNAETGKPLIVGINTQGYCHVTLGKKLVRLHRIIADAFIHNPEDKKTVNHIDGDKKNNSIDNLEWATYSENNKHAYDTGLKVVSNKTRESAKTVGLNNRKLGEDLSSELCEAYDTGMFTQKEIAIGLGVNQATISRIITGAI